MRWLHTIVVLMISLIVRSTSTSCRPVPLKAAQVAARCSYQLSRSRLWEGGQVYGTTFKVKKIVTTLFRGHALKVVVAQDGGTAMICFDGGLGRVITSFIFYNIYLHFFIQAT